MHTHAHTTHIQAQTHAHKHTHTCKPGLNHHAQNALSVDCHNVEF